MNPVDLREREELFYKFGDALVSSLSDDESLTVSLSGEKSFFARFNHGKVRQLTNVDQGNIVLCFLKNNREVNYSIPYTDSYNANIENGLMAIEQCREDSSILVESKFISEPKNNGESSETKLGSIPSAEKLIESVLCPLDDADDFIGILTSGISIRGSINSAKQKLWFTTESFYVDFSIYNDKRKAVKGCYAGTAWKDSDYIEKITDAKRSLKLLDLPEINIERGEYKVYLAPAAVSEIIDTLSWGTFGVSSIKQGQSAFIKLYNKEKSLSPKFTLSENFELGLVPKFNELGEISSNISLVKSGKLDSLLVSTKSSLEYGVASNSATESELLRAAEISTGTLKKEEILKRLDTGVFISNLHYLNWSDVQNASITGMTRYACFWVENGKIIGPIKDMRFDDSIFRIFGSELEDLTNFSEIIPSLGTYEERNIGGSSVPGALISKFNFNL